MRKFLFAAGLLLLLPSLGVSAQIVPTALSPWVQEVLDRAEQGISLAGGIATTPCGGDDVTAEIENNLSLIRQLVVSELVREAESQILREGTVCLEHDRRLFEEKLKRLQDGMDDAVRNCRLGSSTVLRENYAFVARAYQSFLKGGMNPAFKDDLLRYLYPAQDQSLWDDNVREPVFQTGSTAPLCPYTTDYGPHSIGYVPTPFPFAAPAGDDIRSFGCDRDTLLSITGPLEEEALDLIEFMDKTRLLSETLYDTVSTSLFNIESIIAVLMGTLPPSEAPGSKPPPPHLELTGCLRPLIPGPGVNDAAELDALLSTYPDYFEAAGYNLSTGSFEPTANEILPIGLLFRPSFDFFLSVPNAGILTRAYTDRREDSGYDRPLPEILINEMYDSFFMVLFRKISTPDELRGITSNIEREMGILESVDRDAMQRMRDASVPLEAAIESLVQVVDEYLPKEYIPELAYFLARSCVDGDCQKTLDAVNKRIHNPYCHPYISGKYTESDAHKRCFCSPDLQGSDPGFWDAYCSTSVDMGKYDSLAPMLFSGCLEEIPLP